MSINNRSIRASILALTSCATAIPPAPDSGKILDAETYACLLLRSAFLVRTLRAVIIGLVANRRSLKDAILGFANGFAGVCEWLEDVEKGVEPIAAAKKAYKNVRRRKVAVKKATRELSETVGGVGYFHFGSVKELTDSGPWTVREAVLGHLGWMKDWYEVYGERRPRNFG